MEIKGKLNKPYTEEQRINFVSQYQYNYELKETKKALEAWGKTDAELLEEAKQTKYDEANDGAKNYLDGGALYEFQEGKHIEATDGNIAKFTAYALAYVTGQLEPTDTVVWNTKEDETVELNQEQIAQILVGLGAVQANVWAVQFPQYLAQIEAAQTVEDVKAIVINYGEE